MIPTPKKAERWLSMLQILSLPLGDTASNVRVSIQILPLLCFYSTSHPLSLTNLSRFCNPNGCIYILLPSLSPLLRGEGRGEGFFLRFHRRCQDAPIQVRSSKPAHLFPISDLFSPILHRPSFAASSSSGCGLPRTDATTKSRPCSTITQQ